MEQAAKKKLQNHDLGNQELRVRRWQELLGEELREKLITQAHNDIPIVKAENVAWLRKHRSKPYASGNKLTRAASTAT